MKKNNKLILISLVIIGAVIGGVMFMNRGDFADRNRETIEENVRNYVERYKLDSEKLVIKKITNPSSLPTGEKYFTIYIEYHGHPYISIALKGDPDTLMVFEPKERIVRHIFEELYLEARYEEFKPAIDYLNSLDITDPLRPEGTKTIYFQTSVGLASEISDELKEAFRKGDDLEHLKQYIEDNIEKISELDNNISIIGIKEGIDDEQAKEIRMKLENMLPKSNYVVEIGVENIATGETQGVFTYLEIK
ncbi:hypothetical protein SAMN05421736_1392 [Evansella caseinilytica]|uniref:Uncharacterized protein n=1 Tax=Evansella caseinilytica TaxID=1503961 RepID=A0A1H3V2D5_9BACI|nr:hypothetical protein [Evansella caseinilytica]SDZ68757.1 hypothetical protein SAMN05421736_1392 [Evansella caseinilytica]